MQPQISIVVPLYNEEAVLPLLISRLNALMLAEPHTIEVVLINDGSADATPAMIQQLALTDERYTAVSFSRNFGHAAAITAGLQHARGTQYLMIIDGDLQDPPNCSPSF